MNSLPIETHQGELRADSRLIASAIGITNKAAVRLISDHITHFELLGVMRFQNAKPLSNSNGGRPEKFAVLNEDQAYLLLAFVRNNEKSVPLKVNLIKSFKQARQKIRILSDSSALALKSVLPLNQYGEVSKNGVAKTSIRNSCFYACKTPKAEKLKQAHDVYKIADQLNFFWLLGDK